MTLYYDDDAIALAENNPEFEITGDDGTDKELVRYDDSGRLLLDLSSTQKRHSLIQAAVVCAINNGEMEYLERRVERVEGNE